MSPASPAVRGTSRTATCVLRPLGVGYDVAVYLWDRSLTVPAAPPPAREPAGPRPATAADRQAA